MDDAIDAEHLTIHKGLDPSIGVSTVITRQAMDHAQVYHRSPGHLQHNVLPWIRGNKARMLSTETNKSVC